VLFEQVSSQLRTLEARIELALCYYREGAFELSRSILVYVLTNLSSESDELRCLALIRLASLERHAGRLQDALHYLTEANALVKSSGPWASGRHHLELASTYKDLAISESDESLFDRSREHYLICLYEFEAIGNLRLLGIAENNLGFLLLSLRRFEEAEIHLAKARRIFEELHDKVRRAQVDDSLARLHLEQGALDLAENVINRAIEALQRGDEDVLLAEVLTTKGVVCSRLGRYAEAKRNFDLASGLAARRGDLEGAGRALLIMVEEMGGHLTSEDRNDLASRLRHFLSGSKQQSILDRLGCCLKVIDSTLH
jgi:tetratricopeptide (TPR) repeat protein